MLIGSIVELLPFCYFLLFRDRSIHPFGSWLSERAASCAEKKTVPRQEIIRCGPSFTIYRRPAIVAVILPGVSFDQTRMRQRRHSANLRISKARSGLTVRPIGTSSVQILC